MRKMLQIALLMTISIAVFIFVKTVNAQSDCPTDSILTFSWRQTVYCTVQNATEVRFMCDGTEQSLLPGESQRTYVNTAYRVGGGEWKAGRGLLSLCGFRAYYTVRPDPGQPVQFRLRHTGGTEEGDELVRVRVVASFIEPTPTVPAPGGGQQCGLSEDNPCYVIVVGDEQRECPDQECLVNAFATIHAMHPTETPYALAARQTAEAVLEDGPEAVGYSGTGASGVVAGGTVNFLGYNEYDFGCLFNQDIYDINLCVKYRFIHTLNFGTIQINVTGVFIGALVLFVIGLIVRR